jgi:integrase
MPTPVRVKDRWVLRICFNYKRKQIALGKVSRSEADYTANFISRLIDVRKAHSSLTPELDAWLSNCPGPIIEDLVSVGLIEARHVDISVQALFDRFLKEYERDPLQEDSTKTRMKNSLKRPPQWFLDLPLKMVNPKVMKRVQDHLAKAFSESTMSKTNGDIRQVGTWAVPAFMETNRFESLVRKRERNPARQEYVTAQSVLRVIEKTKSPDLKAAFVLARFAGLRVTSELFCLAWTDIDWSAGAITALNSKGKPKGTKKRIPLFKVLDEVLSEIWGNAPPKWNLVMSEQTVNQTASDFYRKAKRAVKKSGEPVWEKLWQNLRASCETDFMDEFPIYKAAAWLGNSPQTALLHYAIGKRTDVRDAIERDVKKDVFKLAR